ncbi:MAG: ABC transporter ATP-binding protein [Candidatus Electrothrix sp. LOE2]|nr:ABC transporter ATP-binding protein [Candidatus Electrothrix sp. LOE2]
MKVIQIENLWKEYRLGVIGHGTLTHDLQSWWARVRGKEDPNSTVLPVSAGQEKQIEGDRFWALRDINLEVKEGEILGIIGKNGAGKSTLLKILSRVTAPTKGSIKVKGRIASLLEVGTGFHPELTGRENIFMNGAILGMSKQEIRHKLDEIIDFSGVEDFIDTPVKRYSSGMYVRLAFAVAAHLEPEILVVDEVLAVGDIEFQTKCLKKMGDIAQSSRTVLFVSHNIGVINSLCERTVWIDNGVIAGYGPSREIVKKYQGSIVKYSPAGDGIFKRDIQNVTTGRITWVESARLSDMTGQPTSIFRYGNDLQLEILLGGGVPRNGTALIWILTDATGNNLGWSNSALLKNFFLVDGKKTACCIIKNLPLAVGRYYFSLSCGIAGGGEVQDIWRNAVPFEVVDCDPFKTNNQQQAEPFGPIIFQHDWKFLDYENN